MVIMHHTLSSWRVRAQADNVLCTMSQERGGQKAAVL